MLDAHGPVTADTKLPEKVSQETKTTSGEPAWVLWSIPVLINIDKRCTSFCLRKIISRINALHFKQCKNIQRYYIGLIFKYHHNNNYWIIPPLTHRTERRAGSPGHGNAMQSRKKNRRLKCNGMREWQTWKLRYHCHECRMVYISLALSCPLIQTRSIWKFGNQLSMTKIAKKIGTHLYMKRLIF